MRGLGNAGVFVRRLPGRRWGPWRLSSGWALDLGRLRIGYHTQPLRSFKCPAPPPVPIASLICAHCDRDYDHEQMRQLDARVTGDGFVVLTCCCGRDLAVAR